MGLLFPTNPLPYYVRRNAKFLQATETQKNIEPVKAFSPDLTTRTFNRPLQVQILSTGGGGTSQTTNTSNKTRKLIYFIHSFMDIGGGAYVPESRLEVFGNTTTRFDTILLSQAISSHDNKSVDIRAINLLWQPGEILRNVAFGGDSNSNARVFWEEI